MTVTWAKIRKKKMDIREFKDIGNKKLAYTGQRLEGMEMDCIGSQGPQQALSL